MLVILITIYLKFFLCLKLFSDIFQVPLHVTFLKTGELKVIGVKYVLSSISVINAVDDEGKIELNSVQDSTLLTFGVSGKQELAVKGPRLNSTKKERMAVTYGKDFRLNPRVLPAMPKLQVYFLSCMRIFICFSSEGVFLEVVSPFRGIAAITEFFSRKIAKRSHKIEFFEMPNSNFFSMAESVVVKQGEGGMVFYRQSLRSQ